MKSHTGILDPDFSLRIRPKMLENMDPSSYLQELYTEAENGQSWQFLARGVGNFDVPVHTLKYKTFLCILIVVSEVFQ